MWFSVHRPDTVQLSESSGCILWARQNNPQLLLFTYQVYKWVPLIVAMVCVALTTCLSLLAF